MTTIEENLSPVQSTSSVTNDPVHRISQDSNIPEVVSSVVQNILSQTCTAVKDMPVTECPSKSSNISQTITDIDIFTQPLLTNIDAYTSSAPQNFNTSQVAVSSAAITDNYSVPVTKTGAESSSITQTISNNDSFTLPLVTSSCSLPVISNSSLPNLMETSYGYSSPVVSTTIQSADTEQIISNVEPPISPVVSSAAIPTDRTLRSGPLLQHHNNVATQTSFEEMEFLETLNENNKQEPLPKTASIKGRRIIDFTYFLQKLKCVNNHSEFGCNLNDIFIKKEIINGLYTSYLLKCAECDFETVISSDPPWTLRQLNTRQLVLILSSIKCGYESMKKLFSEMGLPVLKQTDFMREYVEIKSQKRNKMRHYSEFTSLCTRSKKKNKKRHKVTPKDIGKNRKYSETYKNTLKDLRKSITKLEEIPMQECVLSDSDNNLHEQVDLGSLLIEDKFEIKEENAPESENESETILPLQTMSAFDDQLVFDQEQVPLNVAVIKQEINSELTSSLTNEIETSNKEIPMENDKQYKVVSSQPKEVRTSQNINQEWATPDMTIIKQEINPDLNDTELTSSLTNENKTSNKEIHTENDKQSKAVSSQTKEVRTRENANQEWATPDMTIIKQEIISHLDNETVTNSKVDEIQMSNKESLTGMDKQTKVMVPQQKDVGAYKNRMVADQERVNWEKNTVIGTIDKIIQENSRLVEPEVYYKEVGAYKNRMVANQGQVSLHENIVTDKVKEKIKKLIRDNPATEIQGIPITATSEEKNLFQSNFKPNVTPTTTCDATSAIKRELGKMYLIPVQHESKSTRYGALFIPQVSPKDQDAVSKVNDNSSQGSMFIAPPGGSMPNIPVAAIGTGTDVSLKVNDNGRQGSIPTALPGGSVFNIALSAAGTHTEAFLVQDTMMAGTAAHIGSLSKSSSVSPISSSIEIIDLSDDESPDQENVQQMTPATQNSSNSIATSKRLSSINMQVYSAFSPHSDAYYSVSNEEVPSYLSDSQEMMGYVDSDYTLLGIADSNLPSNTKESFQMPSMSSTTPLQALQQYLPLQPQVEHWNLIPTFSDVPSAIENKKATTRKRKRCGECSGCQTKTSCGVCSSCINVRSHQVCKMRKCEQLKKRKQPVLPSYTSL